MPTFEQNPEPHRDNFDQTGKDWSSLRGPTARPPSMEDLKLGAEITAMVTKHTHNERMRVTISENSPLSSPTELTHPVPVDSQIFRIEALDRKDNQFTDMRLIINSKLDGFIEISSRIGNNMPQGEEWPAEDCARFRIQLSKRAGNGSRYNWVTFGKDERRYLIEELIATFANEHGSIGLYLDESGKVAQADIRDSARLTRTLFSGDRAFAIFHAVDIENVTINNQFVYRNPQSNFRLDLNRLCFDGTKFKGLDLNQVELSGSSFIGANWEHCNFHSTSEALGCNFSNANWHDCRIAMTLKGSKMNYLQMHDSKIASFPGARFDLCSVIGLSEIHGDWHDEIVRGIREKNTGSNIALNDLRSFWHGFKRGWVAGDGYFAGCINPEKAPRWVRSLVTETLSRYFGKDFKENLFWDMASRQYAGSYENSLLYYLDVANGGPFSSAPQGRTRYVGQYGTGSNVTRNLGADLGMGVTSERSGYWLPPGLK